VRAGAGSVRGCAEEHDGALGKVRKRVGNGKDVRAAVESNCPSRRFCGLLCASMVAGPHVGWQDLKNGRAFGRCEGKVGREVV